MVLAQSTTKYLIGVHPDKLNHYTALEQQTTFTCLDGSATIPRESVNDDYCDCGDASDEPGTSACTNGQYFCHNQGYLPSLIPSSWVNDGQCDCCDATDEYNNPGEAKCRNICESLGAEYRREQEMQREIYNQGSNLRSQYKEQAKVKREQNNELLQQYKRELTEKENAIKRIEEEMNSDFGPSSVFLPLKGRCFNFKDREYTYTYCPFERATQESNGGMQTELGRWSAWTGSAENPYSRQKYEGGVQCWNGPARSTVVNIGCGVEDKITSVTEPSKCEYVYDFMTPAACPDTDPPREESKLEQEAEIEGKGEIISPDDASHEITDDQLEQPEYYDASLEGSNAPTEVTPTHDEL